MSVWRPSLRRRLSRCDLSELIDVVSTVRSAAVRVVVEPLVVSVIVPVTLSVRPTASDWAGRFASCSVTRYPAWLPLATVHVPATSPVDPPLVTLAAAPVEAAAVGSLDVLAAPVPVEAAALGTARRKAQRRDVVATQDLVIDEESADREGGDDDDAGDDEDTGPGHRGSPFWGGTARSRRPEPSHRFLRSA